MWFEIFDGPSKGISIMRFRHEVQVYIEENVFSAFRSCAMCQRLQIKGNVEDGPKMLKCSICHVGHYCDKTCQQNHWPEHKKVCKPQPFRPVANIRASEIYAHLLRVAE